MFTKKLLSLYFLLAILFITLTGCSGADKINSPTITINNHTWQVELADTPQKQYQGLSNRDRLCDNCGMLFDFQPAQTPGFVMRDMNFPLDIIWITDNKILAVNQNLQPESGENLQVYQPPQAVDYVLEINAGDAEKNQIKVGDIVNVIVKK